MVLPTIASVTLNCPPSLIYAGGEVLVWSKVPLCSEDETMRSSEDGVRWVKCCR